MNISIYISMCTQYYIWYLPQTPNHYVPIMNRWLVSRWCRWCQERADLSIGWRLQHHSPHLRRCPKTSTYQWPFQDLKLEVPTTYKAYNYKAYVREYPHQVWPYMVQYPHFRILEFPLSFWSVFPLVCIGKSTIGESMPPPPASRLPSPHSLTHSLTTTFGGSDVASLHYTTLHYRTLHYTTLQYTTLH